MSKKKKSPKPAAKRSAGGSCPNCKCPYEAKENDRRTWAECPRCNYVDTESIVAK